MWELLIFQIFWRVSYFMSISMSILFYVYGAGYPTHIHANTIVCLHYIIEVLYVKLHLCVYVICYWSSLRDNNLMSLCYICIVDHIISMNMCCHNYIHKITNSMFLFMCLLVVNTILVEILLRSALCIHTHTYKWAWSIDMTSF